MKRLQQCFQTFIYMLANISLSTPVSTASVESSFSQMKQLKTRLQNCLSDKSQTQLMKVVIESLGQLKNNDLEEIVTVWNKKKEKYLFSFFFFNF